jgi:ATP/maltotriose-dependent transcriptional regulator MalT
MTAPREHRGRSGDVSAPEPSHFLAPPAGDPQVPLIARPRLRARLDEAAPGALVLVSAGAGYGKTTLVADWLATAGRRCLWLSLADDADTVRFWTLVIEAFGSIDPELPTNDFVAAMTAAERVPAGLARAFAEAVARRRPSVTMVLEDYHVDHGLADCCAPLQELLDELPPSVQVIVISRGDPKLPLPRRRVQGRLVEIRSDDLAFTRAESAAFLSAHLGASALRPSSVTMLHDRCEGWPAAISIAAQSLRHHDSPDSQARTFDGDVPEVSDYLRAEVLDRLSPADRQFMRDISIVDEFAAPLSDAITQRTDSAAVLRGMRRANRFTVELDHRGQWHRFHRLFRQLLLQELHATQPTREPELHHRASEWYLQEGQIDRSISHAVRSRELDRAKELILANWIRFVVHWRVGPVAGWLDLLPEAAIVEDRRLAYVAAAMALIDGNGSRFSEYLAVLNAGSGARTDDEPPGQALSGFAWFYGVDAMRDAAAEAVELLSKRPNPFWLWNAQAAYGRALYLSGDPAAALPVLELAIQELTLTRFPVLYVYAMGWAALVSDECGQHDQAWRLAERAQEAVEANRLRHVAHMGIVEVARGRLIARRGDLAAGRAHLERGVHHAQVSNEPLDQVVARLELIPVLAAMGDHIASRARLAEAADALARVPDAAALHERLEALRHRLRLRVSQRDHLPEPLSERELGILRLLGGSLSQPEIAAELGISAHTVKSHARAIYRKLGVSTRDEALSEARDLHLLGSST